MKKIIVLGSTGSLGTQTLEVLKSYQQQLKVVGLSAHTQKALLEKQREAFEVPRENTVLTSQKTVDHLVSIADVVVNVLPGTAGIEPTIHALKAGKTVLLGNKESLVAEGQKVMKLAEPGKLIPLDSEHNAIYEILRQYPHGKINSIVLPASGGPFLGYTESQLQKVTAAQALNHPKWKMGPKITIESATLLNKGLEVIEAHHLFALPLSKIHVKVHPECQIHGVVEFKGKTTTTPKKKTHIAYISNPDMRIHIENALRVATNLPSKSKKHIQEINLKNYNLTPPNHALLPGIKIVTAAFQKHPTKMHQFLKKEEAMIHSFLKGKIAFTEIFSELSQTLQ